MSVYSLGLTLRACMRTWRVQVNNLFITGGQFLASVVDGVFANVPHGWRYMLGLSGIPALVMVCTPLLHLRASRLLTLGGAGAALCS